MIDVDPRLQMNILIWGGAEWLELIPLVRYPRVCLHHQEITEPGYNNNLNNKLSAIQHCAGAAKTCNRSIKMGVSVQQNMHSQALCNDR